MTESGEKHLSVVVAKALNLVGHVGAQLCNILTHFLKLS